MSVGKIGPFELGKDDWSLYVDRLEQYFIANDVKPIRHVATLISVVGSEMYELMVNLCTPDKPSSKSFSELVKVVQGHLQPRPSILAQRFKFRQRVQQSGEAIAEYVADLKKLSKHCGFTPVSLKENLRDQFVCGILKDYTRQRLFAEEDVTFEAAFSLAVTIEAAEADAALMESCVGRNSSGIATATSVHQMDMSVGSRRGYGFHYSRRGRVVTSDGSRAGSENRKGGAISRSTKYGTSPEVHLQEQLQCNVCGKQHKVTECKYKNYVCRVCNREGHLKKMCPKLQRHISFHNLGDEQEDEEYNDTIGNSDSSDEVDNRCLLADLEEGRIGKLLIHRSGRVSLALGDTIFEVSMGTKAAFHQEVMSVAADESSRSANLVALGALQHKLNLVPHWETMFRDMPV